MSTRVSILPVHGPGRLVVLTDVAHELSLQVRDPVEYSVRNHVTLDLTVPDLSHLTGVPR